MHRRLMRPGRPKGEAVHNARLDAEKVREIRRRVAAGEKVEDLAAELGLGRSTVYAAAAGHTWNCVR